MRLPGASYTLKVENAVLEDLRRRIEMTRFPQLQAGADWEFGTPIAYARRLRDYWLAEFDWRQWEARINGLTQRMVEVDGLLVHVIVVQGSGSNPMPLLLANGWPSSFIELLDVADALAHPERHGGNAEDAFTVIMPSIPGYGLSPPPAQPVLPRDIAGLWSKLMVEGFDIESYVAFGSDWGSLIVASMAQHHADRLAAIMITSAGGIPAQLDPASLTEEELAYQQAAAAQAATESAYQAIQSTKPQTLAFGQTDSPIGLAAWIVEKFHGWTVPGSTEDAPFDMDVLIANVMLYWIGGCIAPMWLYLCLRDMANLVVLPNTVPAGFLQFPGDLMPPAPRSWMERSYNVQHFFVGESGGHFPALDNGPLIISEMRKFFAPYRT